MWFENSKTDRIFERINNLSIKDKDKLRKRRKLWALLNRYQRYVISYYARNKPWHPWYIWQCMLESVDV